MPKILVEARPVTLGPVSLGADHLYLVYRNDRGEEVVIGGDPDDPEGIVGGGFDIPVNRPIEASAEARDGDSPADRSAVELGFPARDRPPTWLRRAGLGRRDPLTRYIAGRWDPEGQGGGRRVPGGRG